MKFWFMGKPPRKSNVTYKDVTILKTAISIFKRVEVGRVAGSNARPVRVIRNSAEMKLSI